MTITTGTHNGLNGSSGAASTAIAGNGEVSQLFTKLLIAQIRYQNPLEPTDPSEFVGQLTQLSQMEALQTLTRQSAASAGMLESLQVLGLGAQVGSQISVAAERVMLADEPVQGRVTLPDYAESASIVLENSGMKRRIELGAAKAGDLSFTIDPAELGLPPGSYTVRIEVDGAPGPAVELFGELQGVRVTATDGVVLQVAHLGAVPSQFVTGFHGVDRDAH